MVTRVALPACAERMSASSPDVRPFGRGRHSRRVLLSRAARSGFVGRSPPFFADDRSFGQEPRQRSDPRQRRRVAARLGFVGWSPPFFADDRSFGRSRRSVRPARCWIRYSTQSASDRIAPELHPKWSTSDCQPHAGCFPLRFECREAPHLKCWESILACGAGTRPGTETHPPRTLECFDSRPVAALLC